MKIILAIFIFSAIVLFHELGHFLLAKKSGIVVTEFSLGMGPRLLSTVKGGTRYSWKLLPFGGSCAMLGEDMEDDQPGTFNSASVWGRIAVVAAGPAFNFILAFLFSVVLVAMVGYDPAEVVSVEQGSAAEEAGLKEGDLITSYQGYGIDLSRDLYLYTYFNPAQEGKAVRMTLERDGEEVDIVYKPDVNVRYLLGFNRSDTSSLQVESLIEGLPLEAAGVEAGDVLTSINGVQVADGEEYQAYLDEHPLSDEAVQLTFDRDGTEYSVTVTPQEYRTTSLGFSYNGGYVKTKDLGILKYSALEVKYLVRTTVLSLKELVTGHLALEELSGPVGVVDAIGDAYEQSREEGPLAVCANMIYMAIFLSANLGVMNLLPIPALDGGRLVFLILEAIRRKPVNRSVEGGIHFAGLILLLGLMVVIMYHDILKIIP